MRLPEIAVKNPVFTVMVFMALFIFGMVSLTMLPRDILPEVEMPAITIVTVYPGASALEVEEQVTKIIENQLSSVTNLKKMTSKSKENVSFISLEFDWGADLNEASNDTRDMLELIKKSLPSNVIDPTIVKVNSSMVPVLIYNITAEESFNGLERIIEDQITNRLKRIPGVGNFIVVGHKEREIKVNVDPYKLQAYGLNIGTISQILKTENITIPGGNITMGLNDISVRVPGDFESIEDIQELIISTLPGKVVRLKDVAEVIDDYKEKDEITRGFKKRSVAIMVQKQSGANTLEVAEAVKKEIAEIQKTLPPDVEIIQSIDSSVLISHSISNVSSTIMYAGIFVVLVVFFFLRSIRNSLIVILTIPFSLIVAFIYMFVADFSINIFSMMALAIAIGMVVDNAIVVLENINKHIENGGNPTEDSIKGTAEMGMAISASTLTTIAVFLPMVFMGGVVGILFKQLAQITSITLIASLFTALTLTPMLCSKLLKPVIAKDKSASKGQHGKLFNLSEKMFTKTESMYRSVLNWAVHNRKSVLFITAVIFVFTLYLGKTVGSDYIPEFDAGDLNISIELPVGTSLEETSRVTGLVEDIVLNTVPKEDILSHYAIIGQTEKGLLSIMGFKEGKNTAIVGAKLVIPDERKYHAAEMADRIREQIEQIPEIEKTVVTGGSMLGKALLGNVKPLEVKVIGNDFEKMNQAALELEQLMYDYGKLTNISTTIDPGKVEFQVMVDKEKARQMGVNTAVLGLNVRQSIYGFEATNYKEAGEEYPVMVRYAPEFRNSLQAIEDIRVSSMLGFDIPLGAIASIEEGEGALEIKRESQQRVIYVSADLDNISLGDAVKEFSEMMNNYKAPDGVILEFGGQYLEQQESFSSLYLLFALGIILVYMVMASQFGSFIDPLIIMFAVPLSIIGVIWAFIVAGQTLSVTTFIGIIMLIGIVVNNGIVLVDYTIQLRAKGKDLMSAVIESGYSRLRPVLMTAMTTILGMFPMALSSGMGSEMWKPLGITIIGGLLVSTLITLILIPVMYTSVHRKNLKK